MLIGHVALFGAQTIIGLAILGDIFQKIDYENYSEGTYYLTKGDDTYEYSKTHSGPHNDEIGESELQILVILLALTTAVLMSIIFFMCCCGCVFGSYFKLYSNIKEYNHVMELQGG